MRLETIATDSRGPKGEVFPDELTAWLNAEPEEGPVGDSLRRIARRENVALLAFIASYAPVRVSPAEERTAAISIPEELGIEYAISQIKTKAPGIEDLYLLVNSPGGTVPSSYVVAHAIRNSFKRIKVFIPHIAASGGTLVAIVGNDIVMGMTGRLGPIDVQVAYERGPVSAYSMSRALSRITSYFRDKKPEEAPYPWRAMAEKLDPVLMEDWSSYLVEIGRYADEILTKSGYDEATREQIIDTLVLTSNPHDFVIHRDRAKEMGLNLSQGAKDMAHLDVMREWLAQHMFTKRSLHCIRYVVPHEDKRKEPQRGGASRKTRRARASRGKAAPAPRTNSRRARSRE